jgi:hypothetical protein
LHYTLGSPYYAVQFDFVRGAKRYRLYADLKEPQVKSAKPRTVNEAAAFFGEPKGVDLAQLSRPDSDLKSAGLIKISRRAAVCAPNAVFPGKIATRTRRCVAVIDFVSDSERSIVLPVRMDNTKESSCWLNGSKLGVRSKNKVALLKGRNRIVVSMPSNRSGLVSLPLGSGLELLKAPEL